MRLTTLSLAFLALLAASAAPAHANLITNGSFENPSVPAGSYTNYTTGSLGITGWTVVGPEASVVSGTFAQYGITFQAQDGNQWLDLTGLGTNNNNDGVSQNVATTIGQTYQLSFYVGSATDNNLFFAATVDLSINGGARQSFTNSTAPTNMLDWKLFTVQFTATTSTTNITFFNGNNSSANNVSGLDNVTLDAVVAPAPEPASIMLFSIGAAAVVIDAVRRRRGIKAC